MKKVKKLISFMLILATLVCTVAIMNVSAITINHDSTTGRGYGYSGLNSKYTSGTSTRAFFEGNYVHNSANEVWYYGYTGSWGGSSFIKTMKITNQGIGEYTSTWYNSSSSSNREFHSQVTFTRTNTNFVTATHSVNNSGDQCNATIRYIWEPYSACIDGYTITWGSYN